MGPSPLQIIAILTVVALLFLAGRLVDRAASENARLRSSRRRRLGSGPVEPGTATRAPGQPDEHDARP